MGIIRKPCAHPCCPALVPQGVTFCDKHKKPAWNRDDQTGRGYGRKWRKLRECILSAEPLCRMCSAKGLTEPATQVDHIINKAAGGTDDPDNLQPLCLTCHYAKTAQESRDARGAAGRASDR